MSRVALTSLLLLSIATSLMASDRYRGEMKITVSYYDFCQGFGDFRYVGRRTYRIPVAVSIGSPSTDGTITESNPFNLYIQPLGNPMAEAGLSLMSAGIAQTYRGPVLLQFWRLSKTFTSFKGQLVKNGTEEGVGAPNVFPSAELMVPCRQEMGVWQQPHALAVGQTTLRGDFGWNSISIRITGKTKDSTRRFDASIEAEK